MANSHGFVQLPPDGAGKRVPQSVMIELEYDQATGSFAEGDIITFSVATNITGTCIGVGEATGTTGEIHIRIDEPVPSTVNITVGENIIVNALVIAKVSVTNDILYFQQVVMTGKDMNNHLEIDEHGSARVSFPEGSPEFDSYGKMRGSAETTLAEYVMSYDELPQDFTTEIVGGATMVYDHDTRGVVITCGLASGDRVTRTSNRYHINQTGFSQLIQFTGSMGDQGKAGVVRRGGYYDDDNGVYFEFKELTFGVGFRSKTTGSVIDTFIPQAEWNKDKLDGTNGVFNPSGAAANPLLANLYFIDVQGNSGIVRFGVILDGIRIVAHELANTQSTSFMSTASLPYRYEQENISAAGSSSEFRLFESIVKTEGPIHSSRKSFTTDSTVAIATVNETPVLTFRNLQAYKTFNNRVTAYPTSFDVYNSGAEALMFIIRFGSTATAGSWIAVDADSSVEQNKTATASTGGRTAISHLVAPGARITVTFPTEIAKRLEMRRNADITLGPEFQLAAKLLTAGTGGPVTVVANWDESAD